MRIYQKHKRKLQRYKKGLGILDAALKKLAEQNNSEEAATLIIEEEIIEEVIHQILEEPTESEENKLKRIQILAWLLTLIIIGGISVNAAIALIAALPALPLYAFWLVFAAVACAAGWTEKQIFYNYIRKFCYLMVYTGPLKNIDFYILKREAKKRYDKSIEQLSIDEAVIILKEHQKERILKKALVVLAVPISLLAGVGHATLSLHISFLFATLLHVSIGGAMLACPYTAAILIAVIFSMLLFYMIHRAIKKNIFTQIKNKIFEIFVMKNWEEATAKERFLHILKCSFLFAATTFIIGLAVLATVLTAGTWLDCSVKFFEISFQLMHSGLHIATQIGITIASFLLATNLMFSLDTSSTTLSVLSKIKYKEVAQSFKEVFQNPVRVLLLPFDIALFLVHTACAAGITFLGSGSIKSLSLPRFFMTIITYLSWTAPTATRALSDGAPLLTSKNESEDKADDFLSLTGDIIQDTVISPIKSLCSGLKFCCRFFKSKEKSTEAIIPSPSPNLEFNPQ